MGVTIKSLARLSLLPEAGAAPAIVLGLLRMVFVISTSPSGVTEEFPPAPPPPALGFRLMVPPSGYSASKPFSEMEEVSLMQPLLMLLLLEGTPLPLLEL